MCFHRFFFFAAALLLTRFLATAHPGVGLVEDSRGNVYYTDLVHVWKISPDGRKTIAVRNAHTQRLPAIAAATHDNHTGISKSPACTGS